jgi:hypothetical protein
MYNVCEFIIIQTDLHYARPRSATVDAGDVVFDVSVLHKPGPDWPFSVSDRLM